MSEHHLFKSKGGLTAIVGDEENRAALHVDDKASKELAELINQRREISVKISHALRKAARGAGGEMLGDDDATIVCNRLRRGL